MARSVYLHELRMVQVELLAWKELANKQAGDIRVLEDLLNPGKKERKSTKKVEKKTDET